MRKSSDCPPVGVVVITWNQREDTLECLQSVFGMTYPRFFVVLVDNASTDGTHEAVTARFPQAEYLANETNRGLSAARDESVRMVVPKIYYYSQPNTGARLTVFYNPSPEPNRLPPTVNEECLLGN